MEMTHIYFVRHAEPNYDNHDDASRELSEKGLGDCGLVTAFLAKKGIDVILSSPYKRAVDTVKDFADKNHYPITTVEAFRERKVDNGWIEDFDSFTQRQWADFDFKLQDGESLAQVQKRNMEALRQILAENKGKTLAIGSHGTALSTIIHFYHPDFGYRDFQRIKGIMPWIVHFAFQEERCVLIEEYNVFTGQGSVIMGKGWQKMSEITEVVAALIWDGERFLICQRPAHKARGLLWEFVGGKVEPGETKEQALIRECREELAITLSVGGKFMEVVHEYPDITVHLTLFNAKIAEGEPKKLEHNDIRWIFPSEIPQYDFCPADREILERIREEFSDGAICCT